MSAVQIAIDRLNREKGELAATIERLTRENASLRHVAELHTAEHNSLAAELAEAQQERDEYRSKLATACGKWQASETIAAAKLAKAREALEAVLAVYGRGLTQHQPHALFLARAALAAKPETEGKK